MEIFDSPSSEEVTIIYYFLLIKEIISEDIIYPNGCEIFVCVNDIVRHCKKRLCNKKNTFELTYNAFDFKLPSQTIRGLFAIFTCHHIN